MEWHGLEWQSPCGQVIGRGTKHGMCYLPTHLLIFAIVEIFPLLWGRVWPIGFQNSEIDMQFERSSNGCKGVVP